MNEREVRHETTVEERRLKHNPACVFQAWSVTEQRRRWLFQVTAGKSMNSIRIPASAAVKVSALDLRGIPTSTVKGIFSILFPTDASSRRV
jgi:hypothetical protein